MPVLKQHEGYYGTDLVILNRGQMTRITPDRLPAGVVRQFGEEVRDQVSSWSPDRGLKLRNPSENSPHVASKRDVNVTKENKRLFKILPYI
ncbi:hypothetical protein AVEN_38397-1 [Araneus ventricosus]|uniref:Uncharacterized protein n=1 Tax=Araneus ventricosus TaxID=182803 RepID=A0A4Y2HC44_ARAVE|nr:hypothetical protein AVEN_38397-1 [Araneus ventricosus]